MRSFVQACDLAKRPKLCHLIFTLLVGTLYETIFQSSFGLFSSNPIKMIKKLLSLFIQIMKTIQKFIPFVSDHI